MAGETSIKSVSIGHNLMSIIYLPCYYFIAFISKIINWLKSSYKIIC